MSETENVGEVEAGLESAEPERGEIEYEASMPLSEAASYFESIVAGMRAGRMRVSHEGTALNLEPTDIVDVSVKAVRKKGREKISFEVKWRMAPVSDLKIES